MNIQHSSAKQTHITPFEIAQAVRNLFGGTIYLDPASSTLANQVIQAKEIFTEADDGLRHNWIAPTVYLNPPGGTLTGSTNDSQVDKVKLAETRIYLKDSPWHQGGYSVQAAWWDKLYYEWRVGHTTEAVFLAFSLELIGKRPEMLRFPNCFTTAKAASPCVNKQGRICFLGDDLKPQKSPTHCCLIVYLPPKGEFYRERSVEFMKRFDQFGECTFNWTEYVP